MEKKGINKWVLISIIAILILFFGSTLIVGQGVIADTLWSIYKAVSNVDMDGYNITDTSLVNATTIIASQIITKNLSVEYLNATNITVTNQFVNGSIDAWGYKVNGTWLDNIYMRNNTDAGYLGIFYNVSVEETISAGSDTDIISNIGRWRLGTIDGFSDIAYLSHIDHFDNTGYALLQTSAGVTHLNGDTVYIDDEGTSIARYWKDGGIPMLSMSTSTLGFGGSWGSDRIEINYTDDETLYIVSDYGDVTVEIVGGLNVSGDAEINGMLYSLWNGSINYYTKTQIDNNNDSLAATYVKNNTDAGYIIKAKEVNTTRLYSDTSLNLWADNISTENLDFEVINGDFAADSDWTQGSGWDISGGEARFAGASGASDTSLLPNPALDIKIGTTYIVSVDMTAYEGGREITARIGGVTLEEMDDVDSYSWMVTAITTDNLEFEGDGTGAPANLYSKIDNAAVEEWSTVFLGRAEVNNDIYFKEDARISFGNGSNGLGAYGYMEASPEGSSTPAMRFWLEDPSPAEDHENIDFGMYDQTEGGAYIPYIGSGVLALNKLLYAVDIGGTSSGFILVPRYDRSGSIQLTTSVANNQGRVEITTNTTMDLLIDTLGGDIQLGDSDSVDTTFGAGKNLRISQDSYHVYFNSTIHDIHFVNNSGYSTPLAHDWDTASPEFADVQDTSYWDNIKSPEDMIVNNKINRDSLTDIEKGTRQVPIPETCVNVPVEYCWLNPEDGISQLCSKSPPKDIEDYNTYYRQDCETMPLNVTHTASIAQNNLRRISYLKQKNNMLKDCILNSENFEDVKICIGDIT